MTNQLDRVLYGVLLVVLLGAAILFGVALAMRFGAEPEPPSAGTTPAPERPAPVAETVPPPVENVSPPVERPVRRPVSELVQRFDAALALAHVAHLADQIGPRYGGKAEEYEAQRYARERLKAAGYDIDVQARIPLLPTSRQTANVIARHRQASSQLRIVVGAHIDSIDEGGGSPGANDNGSGVGVLLEAARCLADCPLPYQLEWVTFGAEESIDGDPQHHHYGSNWFVAQEAYAPVNSPVVGMISMDMIAVGDTLHAVTYPAVLPREGNPLLALAVRSAERLGIPLDSARQNAYSDHEAFALQGIPHVWFFRRVDPRYHTSEDRSVFVAAEPLAIAGRLLIHLLASVGEEELQTMAAACGVASPGR